MTLVEFVEIIAAERNLPKEEVAIVLNDFFEKASLCFIAGWSVKIRGFGSFKRKYVKGRTYFGKFVGGNYKVKFTPSRTAKWKSTLSNSTLTLKKK